VKWFRNRHRDATETYILALTFLALAHRPRYTNDIGAIAHVSPGRLYPVLIRWKALGWIECGDFPPPDDQYRGRTWYRVTGTGRMAFDVIVRADGPIDEPALARQIHDTQDHHLNQLLGAMHPDQLREVLDGD